MRSSRGGVVQLWLVYSVQNVYSFTNCALQSAAHAFEHCVWQVFQVLSQTRNITDNLLWFCLGVLPSSSTVS